jgi:trans-aconitate 2-methyltransferase
LNRIEIRDPTEIYDLGAGAGNVTRLLKQRWPNARVTGVDSSQDMLDAAAKSAPDIAWEKMDLASWRPARPAELIYSNAALHWVGNHERLFPALVAALAQRGVLAVQIPHNFSSPSHTLIDEAARSGPWRVKLEPLIRPVPVAEASFYYDLLAPRVASLDIWETEYLHALEGAHPIKEWIKGTWLKPLLDALDGPESARLEALYAEMVAKAYPPRPDGRTLFPFRRLFIIASV